MPSYAYQDRAVRAGGEKDLLATFRGDDGGSITVAIEPGECDRGELPMLNLCLTRSGLLESDFTRDELGKVLHLAGILYADITQGGAT